MSTQFRAKARTPVRGDVMLPRFATWAVRERLLELREQLQDMKLKLLEYFSNDHSTLDVYNLTSDMAKSPTYVYDIIIRT